MKDVVNLYKPISYSPLQVVEAFREAHPTYADAKLGYAGRLDPMASGVLLVLVGDENKRRAHYELLPKIYEFEVLFGVSTDTYDVMGRIEHVKNQGVALDDLRSNMLTFAGEWEQEYPAYSSVLVHGKPLYWWARNGKLSEIAIPSKTVRVDEIEMLGVGHISGDEVAENAVGRIIRTTGEFRQEEIAQDWRVFGERHGNEQFMVAKMRIKCSSGVYVRSIAHSLGGMMRVPALAYSIHRTRVGEFDLSSSVRIDILTGNE